MKIYLIEDDKTLRFELSKQLNLYGYHCYFDDNYINIVSLALSKKPDIILLDINLPMFDGYHICREIRKLSDVPIIIITSRNTDMDELMGMNLGADDFITKPYNIQILIARISSILKRYKKNNVNNITEYKELIFKPEKGIVKYKDKEMELTRNEIKILSCLIRNNKRIVSRDELMNELWQSDEFVDDNTLTVNINRLRTKLNELGATNFISTKRGQGYSV